MVREFTTRVVRRSPDGPQVGRPPGAGPRRPADPGQVRGLGHDRSPRPKRPGASSVELPGLEPGSFATSPGLLRAQFARSLCSALRIRRTRPDDGPSQRWKSRRAPLTRPGGKSLSRCQTPDQGRIRADRHALALGSEGVVALSVLGAYQVAATLTVVSSLHRHASPGSIDEVETKNQPLFVSCGREVCRLPQEIQFYARPPFPRKHHPDTTRTPPEVTAVTGDGFTPFPTRARPPGDIVAADTPARRCLRRHPGNVRPRCPITDLRRLTPTRGRRPPCPP